MIENLWAYFGMKTITWLCGIFDEIMKNKGIYMKDEVEVLSKKEFRGRDKLYKIKRES